MTSIGHRAIQYYRITKIKEHMEKSNLIQLCFATEKTILRKLSLTV